MTPAPAESPARPRRNVWTLIGVIFAAQLALIYWLAAPRTTRPPRTAAGPEFFMLGDDVPPPPGAINPTLLALPGPDGFSGRVWLRIPTLDYQLEEWQEPPRFLTPRPGELGGDLSRLVLANLHKPVELPPMREPLPAPIDQEFVPSPTIIILTGDLAGRTLLSTLVTNSWPSTNLLSDSEVLIAVNAQGQIDHPPLLEKKSGSLQADADALDQAARLQFKPLRRTETTGRGLTWGRLVFQWQTVPLPDTNAPAGVAQ